MRIPPNAATKGSGLSSPDRTRSTVRTRAAEATRWGRRRMPFSGAPQRRLAIVPRAVAKHSNADAATAQPIQSGSNTCQPVLARPGRHRHLQASPLPRPKGIRVEGLQLIRGQPPLALAAHGPNPTALEARSIRKHLLVFQSSILRVSPRTPRIRHAKTRVGPRFRLPREWQHG